MKKKFLSFMVAISMIMSLVVLPNSASARIIDGSTVKIKETNLQGEQLKPTISFAIPSDSEVPVGSETTFFYLIIKKDSGDILSGGDSLNELLQALYDLTSITSDGPKFALIKQTMEAQGVDSAEGEVCAGTLVQTNTKRNRHMKFH